ncbi:MAG: hypothetical protein R3C53_24100 [Pirellulaceae bacterium]
MIEEYDLMRITDDPVQFRRFFDSHRGQPVLLASLGTPCWTMVLKFLHPDADGEYDSIGGRQSEMWVSPTAICFPTFRWNAELVLDWNIEIGCGEQIHQLRDAGAGVWIRWLPDTAASLVVNNQPSSLGHGNTKL